QKPDDITPLGITRPVQLLACDPIRIKDLAVDTRLTDDGSAQVEVEVELESAPSPAAGLELTLSPRNFSSTEHYRVSTSISNRTVHLVIPVKEPRLWWTWDHGRPNLYSLNVRLSNEAGEIVDGRTLPVGIREIERIGWTFYLNRKRMFIRGTN